MSFKHGRARCVNGYNDFDILIFLLFFNDFRQIILRLLKFVLFHFYTIKKTKVLNFPIYIAFI